MGKHHGLPFKVGQLAEARSVVEGYRGAWFRCLAPPLTQCHLRITYTKIKDIAERKGHSSCSLEYFDFPDEKVVWARLFQKFPTSKGRIKERKLQLILRPIFPQSFRESEVPNLANSAEVVVIYRNIWKVGDLVDWWSDGCYWSGRITDMLGSDKVQITLYEPPFGEGSSYEALCKDLRPSLEWSLEDGWTVLKSQDENEISGPCAHMIMPSKKDNDASPIMPHGQDYSKLVNDHREVGDESKKQPAGIQPLLEMPRVDLNMKQPEQAINTNGNLEEKLQENKGIKVINSDNKTCTATTVDRDGGRKAIGDKKIKHATLEEVIHPKTTMRKRNIDLVEDCETGKAVFNERKAGKMEVTNDNSKLVNDNSEVSDRSKKQSADMQLPLDVPKVDPLKIKQLEQAIDGKACLEEKLQKNEGTEVINGDEKTCIGTTVDLDGERKASVDKKMKHANLEEVTRSKNSMQKKSIDIMEDCETGKAVFDETTEGAEEIPTKSPAKCLYDVQDFSKNLRAWRNDYNLAIYPDTIESSILALEELINKIQWVNGVVQFGMKWTTSRKPSWQFFDGPEDLSRE